MELAGDQEDVEFFSAARGSGEEERGASEEVEEARNKTEAKQGKRGRRRGQGHIATPYQRPYTDANPMLTHSNPMEAKRDLYLRHIINMNGTMDF